MGACGEGERERGGGREGGRKGGKGREWEERRGEGGGGGRSVRKSKERRDEGRRERERREGTRESVRREGQRNEGKAGESTRREQGRREGRLALFPGHENEWPGSHCLCFNAHAPNILSVNTTYCIPQSGIWGVISRVMWLYFHEPKASENIAYE